MTNFYIDDSKLECYQTEYANTNCVFLPGLLKKNVLDNLINKIGNIEFETKYETDDENKFGKVLFIPLNATILFTFQMIFNNKELFALLEKITGCQQIGNFVGRIHRSEEGGGHEIKWHGDNADSRLLAMTLNLGTDRYTGAEFQLRETATEKMLREFGQTEAGDAFIFKIAPELQHRLAPLKTGKRTVGVGWFRQNPDMATFLKTYLKP
jgi:hypothetical protein